MAWKCRQKWPQLQCWALYKGVEGHLLWGFSKASGGRRHRRGWRHPQSCQFRALPGESTASFPLRSHPKRQVLFWGQYFWKCVFQNMRHRIFYRNRSKEALCWVAMETCWAVYIKPISSPGCFGDLWWMNRHLDLQEAYFPGPTVPRLSEWETLSSPGIPKGSIFRWASSADILSSDPWQVQVHPEGGPRDSFRVRSCIDMRPVLKQPCAYRQPAARVHPHLPLALVCLYDALSISSSLLSKGLFHFNWRYIFKVCQPFKYCPLRCY